MSAKKLLPSTSRPVFDVHAFLHAAGVSRRIVRSAPGVVVFAQGAQANSVFYICEGGVKLGVLSAVGGREAVVAMLGPGDFFGEGCLAGQPRRMGTATALAPTTMLRIPKREMMRTLRDESAMAYRFITHMLARNIRIEEDLLDQLLSSSEKRLARALLVLARYGEEGEPRRVLPKLSRGKLAQMAGTTGSRANFFMKKFRKQGFIQNNGRITINGALLRFVLHE